MVPALHTGVAVAQSPQSACQQVEDTAVLINDVYPGVLDVHYRVSHTEVGSSLVDAISCNQGPCTGELVDLETEFEDQGALHTQSNVSDSQLEISNGAYPEVLDVHSQFSRHGVDIAICTLPALDPEAAQFIMRDSNLVHRGILAPDLAEDWETVQQVQAGGSGQPSMTAGHTWINSGVSHSSLNKVSTDCAKDASVASSLPFQLVDDINEIMGIAPKQILKVGNLKERIIRMPSKNFVDKLLPTPKHELVPSQVFSPDYFVALHNLVAAPGYRGDGSEYECLTHNHLGARISLPHVQLNIKQWRYHLTGYEKVELVQFLEFGFPLGLENSPTLESTARNHGSAYSWYEHVDKFICKEVIKGGMTGPFKLAPWWDTMVSPLMTAHKKPCSRRTVFDATFGEHSLNNATPGDIYMGQPCEYAFPKVEDFKQMVLEAGKGAYMWKRDLARFYLQLPVDPVEYHRLGVVWRGLFFFFIGLAFGLRHSGLNGQKVTDALSWILRRLGQDSGNGKNFNCVNYVDDMGGVEKAKERAEEAFMKLAWLLKDLGLEESRDKAEGPTTRITYLGVQFDSVSMTMSVPPAKLTEIKAEIRLWLRRTTICKRELQSLLGKLFWVAKVVTHSRVFLGRLLAQLRAIHGLADHKKVKLLDESRKDILWWTEYLERVIGISMMVNEDPIPLSFEQLLDSPHDLCAGDATPTGGGAWHGNEYWSQKLPEHLQDPRIPIHLKEFWVLLVSAKQWGPTWTGRCMVLYCDNDAVVETVQKKKPKDAAMLSLLREFLFVVVTNKFYPVIRKIGTKENQLADFISRRFDQDAAASQFSNAGLVNMELVQPKTRFFHLSAKW